MTSRPMPRWAYPGLILLVGAALGVSGAPAPLYGIYADEFGFEPITTTVVFAVYAVAALVSVLVSGTVSDRFGRRPVLGAALVLILIGLVVFIGADGVPALMVARVLHGLGIGAVMVVASAALLDLRPDEGALSGKRTGISLNLGIMVAIGGTAWIAEYGTDPLVTPFVILGVLMLAGAVLIAVIPETHTQSRTTTLFIARPRVPESIRLDFRFAALGVMASWSVLGVFLSIFPSLAARAADTDNLLFGGGIVALSSGAAAASQQVGMRWTAHRAAIIGDLGTALSLLAAIGAVASGSAWVIGAASVVLGFFFGLAFGASLRHLGQVVPAAHRGEVMSAFYLLAYSAMTVPTIAAGAAATIWSPEAIFAPFMAAVAAACTAAALLGLRVGEERALGS